MKFVILFLTCKSRFNTLVDLNRPWGAFSNGGQRPKVSHRIHWLCPFGFLKLNLYGSYLQYIQNGGLGGVIRDSDGSVIRSWFGSVDSSNVNEAEVFALLIGCHELLKLNGYSAIIEGDSFSAILWGFGKASHSWRLRNWVEEVQAISTQLGASFHHIPREANIIADSLAREVEAYKLFV